MPVATVFIPFGAPDVEEADCEEGADLVGYPLLLPPGVRWAYVVSEGSVVAYAAGHHVTVAHFSVLGPGPSFEGGVSDLGVLAHMAEREKETALFGHKSLGRISDTWWGGDRTTIYWVNPLAEQQVSVAVAFSDADPNQAVAPRLEPRRHAPVPSAAGS